MTRGMLWAPSEEFRGRDPWHKQILHKNIYWIRPFPERRVEAALSYSLYGMNYSEASSLSRCLFRETSIKLSAIRLNDLLRLLSSCNAYPSGHWAEQIHICYCHIVKWVLGNVGSSKFEEHCYSQSTTCS